MDRRIRAPCAAWRPQWRVSPRRRSRRARPPRAVPPWLPPRPRGAATGRAARGLGFELDRLARQLENPAGFIELTLGEAPQATRDLPLLTAGTVRGHGLTTP